MKNLFILCFLVINLIGCQKKNIPQMNPDKPIEKIHFLDVMFDTMLDIIAEKSVGEIDIDLNTDLQKEAIRRVSLKYSEKEIEELKSKVPKDIFLNPTPKSETLQTKIDYFNQVFIPQTSEIRSYLIKDLSEKDKLILVKIKKQYLLDRKDKMIVEKQNILADQELSEEKKKAKIEILSLQYDLNKIYPAINRTDQKKKWYIDLVEIANKTPELPETEYNEFLSISKEKMKIMLADIFHRGPGLVISEGRYQKNKLEFINLLLIN